MVADQHAASGERIGAFFDVDRTLLRGSSLLHVARPMRSAGLLPTRAMLHSVVVQARFSRSGFDEMQIREGLRGVGSLVMGIDAAVLAQFATRVVPTHVLPRVYAAGRSRLEWHRAQGHSVFLVSSSPTQFIAVLGSLLGVEDVAATEAEIRDGRYTGSIVRFCHGAAKAEAVAELAACHHIDLARSYAYGDSFVSDLAMLDLVGRPVCVNADRALIGEAEQRGWPLVSFAPLDHPRRPTDVRRLPAGVMRRSVPAMRTASRHVRTTRRSLRHL